MAQRRRPDRLRSRTQGGIATMSAIDPVSRPQNLSQGVRGTAGRPLPDVLVRRPEPSLDDDAVDLLAALPRTGSSQLDLKEAAKLAERVGSNPTRSGGQALAYIAWSC